VVGFIATLITMSGFGDHHPGLRDHDDRNAQYLRNPQARDMIEFAEALFQETDGIVPIGDAHFPALCGEATRLARLAASDPCRALGAEGDRCDD